MDERNGEKHFFDGQKEWSARKIDIISKYVAAATKVLRSVRKDIYYIDGFAGPGIYDDSKLGSPVEVAKIAQQYYEQDKRYWFKCINVEIVPSYFESLTQVTKAHSAVVTNLGGDFNSNLEKILSIIGDSAIVGFLDPFGIKGLDLESISRLVSRKAPTDLWIRLNPSDVLRRAGYYGTGRPEAPAHLDLLSRSFGTNDIAALCGRFLASDPETNRAEVLKTYTHVLSDLYYRNSYRGESYVGSYGVGSLQDENKYHLFFATGVPKGFTLASDVVNNVDRAYIEEKERHEFQRKPQLLLIPELELTQDELFNSIVEQIKKDIVDRYRGTSVTRLEAHAALLENRFGEIRGPHLTRALTALIKEDIVVTNGQPSNDKTVLTFRDDSAP